MHEAGKENLVISGFEYISHHCTEDRYCQCIWRSFYFLSMCVRLNVITTLSEKEHGHLRNIVRVVMPMNDGIVTA